MRKNLFRKAGYWTVYLGDSPAQLQRMEVYFQPVVQFLYVSHNILQQVEPHLQALK